jgi:hypothetical protein
MRFTVYEVMAGVWSFDAPKAVKVKPREYRFIAPLDARMVRVRGEALLRCGVNGRDKLVAADVARSCATRGVYGFKPC